MYIYRYIVHIHIHITSHYMTLHDIQTFHARVRPGPLVPWLPWPSTSPKEMPEARYIWKVPTARCLIIYDYRCICK